MTSADVVTGLVGALMGVGASILGGVVVWWVRRSGETRDRTGELGAQIAALQVSVGHVGDEVRTMRHDTRDSFLAVGRRFDALPCHDYCKPPRQVANNGGRA